MKKGLTELVFVLDKSGSMSGLEKDTIGGFNSMLEKQKEVDGECLITTVLFDNGYELLHDRIDIRAVSPITEKEYSVGGSTALLDAIGRTINKIGNAQHHTADEFRAENVMFVTITDGEETPAANTRPTRLRHRFSGRRKSMAGNSYFSVPTLTLSERQAALGSHRTERRTTMRMLRERHSTSES
jgi:uncharacterized protein YegL